MLSRSLRERWHGAGGMRELLALAWPLVVSNSFWTLQLALGEHPAEAQVLETAYFRCLCFSALPTALFAAACSFYTGRGDSRKALFVNGVGLLVTGLVGYAWTYGRWGLPEWGITGTGWATV